MGDYKAAELYLKKAFESYNEFFKEEITPEHYNNLGNLYAYLGDYTAAEFYYKLALKSHLNVVVFSTGVSYAYLLSKTNRERKAYQVLSKTYLKKSNEIRVNFGWGGGNTIENLTFNQKEVYWKKENSFFADLSFFANEVFQVVPKSVGLNYDAALFFKGKLLAEKITDDDFYLEIDELRWELDVKKRLLVDTYTYLPSRKSIFRDEFERSNNSFKFKVDSLDKRLRLIWPEYAQQNKNLRITWNQVQQNLEEGEMAIEFVRFKNKSDSLIYYNALVLKKGDHQPKLIKLCAERDLQSNYLASGFGAYYELIWQPLESALQGINTIYYAPTGDLYNVPLHEIYSPKGSGDEILPESINPVGNVIFPEYPNTNQEATYFMNRYTFHRLTSTRYLAMGFKRRVKELKGLTMEKVGVIHD
jgi:tetratricopeptide (TPR) repeat protein